MTVKLDGDVIMGEIVNDKRYHSQGLGSVEDLRSVCSCTCVTCHPNFFSRDQQGRRKSSLISPPAIYSDYYQTPPRSRPESVHDIRSRDFYISDYGLQVATISGQSGLEDRDRGVLGGKQGGARNINTKVTPSLRTEYRENISTENM